MASYSSSDEEEREMADSKRSSSQADEFFDDDEDDDDDEDEDEEEEEEEFDNESFYDAIDQSLLTNYDQIGDNTNATSTIIINQLQVSGTDDKKNFLATASHLEANGTTNNNGIAIELNGSVAKASIELTDNNNHFQENSRANLVDQMNNGNAKVNNALVTTSTMKQLEASNRKTTSLIDLDMLNEDDEYQEDERMFLFIYLSRSRHFFILSYYISFL